MRSRIALVTNQPKADNVRNKTRPMTLNTIICNQLLSESENPHSDSPSTPTEVFNSTNAEEKDSTKALPDKNAQVH